MTTEAIMPIPSRRHWERG